MVKVAAPGRAVTHHWASHWEQYPAPPGRPTPPSGPNQADSMGWCRGNGIISHLQAPPGSSHCYTIFAGYNLWLTAFVVSSLHSMCYFTVEFKKSLRGAFWHELVSPEINHNGRFSIFFFQFI